MDPRSEPELVAAAQGGDEAAFCQLVECHQAPLRGYLASLVIEPEAVFDLAQEVFLVAYRKLHELDPEREIGPWLRGIARNEALAHNRAAARRSRRERSAAILAAALEAERAEPPDGRLTALRRCIEQLASARPEVHRLLELRYFKDAALVEIAGQLGIAEGALRVRLLRARGVLRACIEQRQEAEG